MTQDKDERDKEFHILANKLVELENNFADIKNITKTINIWVKENDYELIPLINMLNGKIKNMAETFDK